MLPALKRPIDACRACCAYLGPTLAVGVAVVAVLAIAARCYRLGSFPGVNGDEAWYGVWVLRAFDGEIGGWTTPAQNPLNPFYVLPLALGQLLFAPALWSLRFASLLSGLALLPLTFVLVRRLATPLAAGLATLLMAALPLNIAYSRFGWDTSQSVLAALLVVWAALERRYLWLALALLAALWVHPTNVFLVPVIAGPIFVREVLLRRPSAARLALLGGAALVVAAVVFWRYGQKLDGARILADVLAPARWWLFAVRFVQLLSGTTVYRYICGSGDELDARLADVLVGAALLVGVLWGARALWRQRRWEQLGLLCGLLLALLALFVIAGPVALRPHYERYGLFLIAPTVVLAALMLPRTNDGAPQRRVVGAVLLASVLLLTPFGANYFAVLHGGSRAAQHPAFRTGPVEPKLAAFRLIAAHRPAGAINVYTSSFWTDRPLRYLMTAAGNLRRGDRLVQLSRPNQLRLRRTSFAVAFVADPFDRFAVRSLRPVVDRVWHVPDHGGRPVLRVYRFKRAVLRRRR